jgi:hypothetical protein
MEAGDSVTQLLPVITAEPFRFLLVGSGPELTSSQALLVCFPGEDRWLHAISLFPCLKEESK